MTDIIDQGCETEQADLIRALAHQQRIAKACAMPFNGICYNCQAAIERGGFCDGDCRDDYQWTTMSRNFIG